MDQAQLTILHIISGDLWAGAEAMAYQLLAGLQKTGKVDLHLFILNEGQLYHKCRQLGIKSYLFDEQQLPFAAIAFEVIKKVREIKPEIIHSHRYKENILSAFAAPFCGKPKLIATQHGRSEGCTTSYLKRFIGRLNQVCLRWAFSQTVAVSKDTSDYLYKKFGLNKNKITVISNGIEIPSVSSSKKKPVEERVITIGSAGRLYPVKQFDTLIEIANGVCKMNSKVQFVIAGDGPERDALQNMIVQFGIEKQVRLLGHVDDMQAFYDSLDIYINTSLHEGTPMSVLEAMASGLPAIAFRVAGLKEMITDNIDGFTIPNQALSFFASKILELIDHPEKLNSFGRKARRKVIDRFSTQKMAKNYLALYYQLNLMHEKKEHFENKPQIW